MDSPDPLAFVGILLIIYIPISWSFPASHLRKVSATTVRLWIFDYQGGYHSSDLTVRKPVWHRWSSLFLHVRRWKQSCFIVTAILLFWRHLILLVKKSKKTLQGKVTMQKLNPYFPTKQILWIPDESKAMFERNPEEFDGACCYLLPTVTGRFLLLLLLLLLEHRGNIRQSSNTTSPENRSVPIPNSGLPTRLQWCRLGPILTPPHYSIASLVHQPLSFGLEPTVIGVCLSAQSKKTNKT